MKPITTKQTKYAQYGGLDLFRLAAAYLVIAIHTSPLASYSLQGDLFYKNSGAHGRSVFLYGHRTVYTVGLFKRENRGLLRHFPLSEKSFAALRSLHNFVSSDRYLCGAL